MAIKIAPKPTKLEKQKALFAGSQKAMPQQVATIGKLRGMVTTAADNLRKATTAAEVLDARDLATAAYDAAKRSARIERAKSAHDEVIAATHRAQADALEIEAEAKRRLADEYDGAQKRGEVGKKGQRTDLVPD